MLLAGASGGYYVWGPSGWETSVENTGGFSFAANVGALFRLLGPLTLGASVSHDYRAKLGNGLGVRIDA